MSVVKAWWTVAGWMIVMAVITSWPHLHAPANMPYADKAVHVTEYAVFAWLTFRAGTRLGWNLSRIWPAVVLVCVALAGLDELHQVIVPGREASFGDFAFNVIGFCLGTMMALMRYGRTKTDEI